MSKNPRSLRRDFAQEHTEHALRKIVGLDLIREREDPESGREVPMTPDDATQEPAMGEMIQAAIAPVTLAGTIVEGQVPG